MGVSSRCSQGALEHARATAAASARVMCDKGDEHESAGTNPIGRALVARLRRCARSPVITVMFRPASATARSVARSGSSTTTDRRYVRAMGSDAGLSVAIVANGVFRTGLKITSAAPNPTARRK